MNTENMRKYFEPDGSPKILAEAPGGEGCAVAAGSAFLRAKRNDGTVDRLLAAGGTLEDVIVALVKQKHELAEKCMRYSLIAPKKIKMADGSYRIWRCPDELVPES